MPKAVSINSDMQGPKRPFNIKYSINGYRSLIDFEMSVNPGINVLVGPNGSGKTNFLSFLEFIGDTLRSGASTAVSRAGGLSRVFSLENVKNANPTIRASISGVADFHLALPRVDDQRLFRFEYDIEIKYNRNLSIIYISREAILFKKLFTVRYDPINHSTVGTVSIVRRNPADDLPPALDVGPRLTSANNRNPLAVVAPYAARRTPSAMLDRIDPSLLAPDESILTARNSIYAFDAVRFALTRGRSFNISPSSARVPDDLLQQPGIATDGTGLTATLHALQSLRRDEVVRRVPRLRKADSSTLDSVIDWTRLVLPALSDIQIVQDVHTGTYIGSLLMESERPLRIPLQAASDGTVKWLAVICYILTSSGVFTLEEPENFLHPKMLEFLISLIRDNFDDERNGSVLISTHSETLINYCKPEELVLFSFEDNRTSCKRLRDPETVTQEINKTGFGLGYYYASNAIS